MAAVRLGLHDRFSDDFENEEAMMRPTSGTTRGARGARRPAHRLDTRRRMGPICALGKPVPDEPFPVTNTTKEFEMISAPPLP
jgi:hypothetical protein